MAQKNEQNFTLKIYREKYFIFKEEKNLFIFTHTKRFIFYGFKMGRWRIWWWERVYLEVVDLLVGGDDPLRLLLAAVDERLHRAVDAVLHEPPHAEELVAERLQIGLEVVPFHS